MNSGVVAFRIAARPPVIRVWPQKIRLNGIRLLSAPMTRNAPHSAVLRGMRCPLAYTASHSAPAAMPTRANTSVSGRTSASATSAKKKVPPHSTESAISSAHSRHPSCGAIRPAMCISAGWRRR